MSLPPARFRKTKNGKWAVMAPVQTLEQALAGDGEVQVEKRNGDFSTFTVAGLGKPFDVDGVQMCYGYGPDDNEDESAQPPSHGAQARRDQRSRPARRSTPPATPDYSRAPAWDPSEPMPEFQGGAEDEWQPDW